MQCCRQQKEEQNQLGDHFLQLNMRGTDRILAILGLAEPSVWSEISALTAGCLLYYYKTISFARFGVNLFQFCTHPHAFPEAPLSA